MLWLLCESTLQKTPPLVLRQRPARHVFDSDAEVPKVHDGVGRDDVVTTW